MMTLVWCLGSGIAFCLALWVIAFLRCPLCHGSGFFEATEVFPECEVTSTRRCLCKA
jgi:hypothetical protein